MVNYDNSVVLNPIFSTVRLLSCNLGTTCKIGFWLPTTLVVTFEYFNLYVVGRLDSRVVFTLDFEHR